jgi:hypothetical protein
MDDDSSRSTTVIGSSSTIGIQEVDITTDEAFSVGRWTTGVTEAACTADCSFFSGNAGTSGCEDAQPIVRIAPTYDKYGEGVSE